jgi:predicted nicotinamide N-methyase
LVPEIRLHQITPHSPLWRAGQPDLDALRWPEPYWAFAWAGGQALARYVLDHPDRFRGRWWDIGAGSGLVGLAAARIGAEVICTDVDPTAAVAIEMNAQLNDVRVEVTTEDWVGRPLPRGDGVLLGDMTYASELTGRILDWCEHEVTGPVWLGDPGRGFFEDSRWMRVASMMAPADADADGTDLRATGVFRLERE